MGDVHQVGKGAHAGAGLARLGDDGLATGPGGGGQGQQDLVGHELAHDRGHAGGIEDRSSIQHPSDQVRAVVEEADHAHVAALGQSAGQLATGFARAEDQHPPPRGTRPRLDAEQP